MRPTVVFFLLAPIASGADWTHLSSPNFELYTTCNEHDARLTLENFEQAHDFFMRVKLSKVSPQLPVTIVAFDTPREYKPYSPRENTPAYYAHDEQRDYIVMTDLEEARKLIALHEYVHVLVQHSGLKLPVWLDEGMADVYSTLEVKGDRIRLGAMPEGRVYSLTHGRWFRLSDLVRVTHDSPDYDESNRAGMFYAESWLLAHMLILGDEYRAKFPAFVEKVSEAGTQAAFAEVYEKTLAQIERGMREYFAGSIGGASFKGTLQKVEVSAPRPATEMETGLLLAKLTALIGKSDDALRRFEKLGAAHAGDPEIEEALAYLYWQKGDRDAALERFRAAIDHGDANWKTYWDCARLMTSMREEHDSIVQLLRKTLERKPDLDDAHLLLGRELMIMGQNEQALAELKQIQSVEEDHAATMYLTMAYASANLGRASEAKQYAEEARKRAHRPDEIAAAEVLLNRGGATAPAPNGLDDPDRPTLRHREPPTPPKKKQ